MPYADYLTEYVRIGYSRCGRGRIEGGEVHYSDWKKVGRGEEIISDLIMVCSFAF